MGTLCDETYNLLNAWLAVVPGNGAHNLRRLALLNTNVRDLSFLFTLHRGARTQRASSRATVSSGVGNRAPDALFLELHHDDVGHTLVQGATGSGKSFLLNFLVTHAQKYDPFTVIFDLGGSYEGLVRQLGGSAWRVGLAHPEFTINPFCVEPTKDHLHFLFSFVRVLIQASGQHRLTLPEDRDLYDAIENVYALEPAQRRLLTADDDAPARARAASPSVGAGGPYASLFDNVEDTLTFQQLQCFDFEGLEQFPMVLEPLWFYVLHRASLNIHGSRVRTTR
jgi:type IV secretion system protein VirB4